ncbi:F0F1 ATP synthase subunit epsilon [Flavobacterium sp. J372]|uniref:F0F1 ATP synthase subunit epsilon n=1 Tax=Flavobacterium sp. J372 TaxID=2898436 RepID=UPI0021511AD1|nr:F0F1 ATP synthase subunit epsilon [Flavobacterium sp. J372]MCR5860986.1 F0F1 ATP synthase subunit epsilon [Flavobacterium sp. J372]
MLLEIVSPEGHLFRGGVTSVTVPGVDGEFQMLNNHANIVSVLAAGTVKIGVPDFKTNGEFTSPKFNKSEKDQKFLLPIKSGTLEMKDNRIIILVD